MMGFNSLKKVEGPGKIALSYEEQQITYHAYTSLPPEGVQCFSKKVRPFQFSRKYKNVPGDVIPSAASTIQWKDVSTL